uniref:Retrovirus-related Pol polyprotein from transposon TNT 1-94-like beta-barrel domain-containing protein n=1 Tax=Passalora fulva TaxID=5499 RepID=A0A9Q8L4L8_PASFU
MTDLAKQMKESRKPKASSSKPARAHATQEDASDSEILSEDDDVDEVAHSTVEAKGKYPSSEWLLDSCASSHMTDQDSLFRTLKPLQKRKWIKVGGGYLQATHIGSAVMGGPSGKQIVLENVLFVPGLGVSLVSWNQFSQQFAVQPPSFTLKSLSSKPVVQTKLRGGVPFIHSISEILEPQHTGILSQERDGTAMANTESEDQWELWHRRCAHLGKGLLRNLHRVTDKKDPIPVPSEHQNCKGGDMDLGITFTNQPSRAPQRNPVGRKPFGAKFSDRGLSETPLRRLGENIEAVSPLSKADNGGSIQNLPESSTPQQPLSVQLPPPPKDIGEY